MGGRGEVASDRMTQQSDGPPEQRAEALSGEPARMQDTPAAGAGQAGPPSMAREQLLADGLARFLGRARTRAWGFSLLLVVATVLAYQPVWRAGFIWDDERHITNNAMLTAPDGWKKMWFSREAHQYYPLVWTSFRLERAVWGDNPAGYHSVNLLLHAISAVLVWRVLRRLGVPGAWLAGVIFALHPVNVESVAWVSQRKNTLAMLFFLVSLGLYLRSERDTAGERADGRWNAGRGLLPFSVLHPPLTFFYWLSLVAFVLALLSKTAVAPLPLVLLGLAWWRRGRIARRDVWRSVPFFAIALILGLVTAWFESYQNAGDIVREDNFWSRLAVAGCAIWFYLFKALLPVNLMPIYPMWQINAAKALSYLPGLLAVGALVLCWRYRRGWGKAGLLCAGYFGGMLLPVLGFVNTGFMRYSLVADHWQYFAIISPIALVSAGLATGFGLPGKRLARLIAAVCGVGVAGLGIGTWRQSTIYANSDTFWRAAVDANPRCWASHYKVGESLHQKGFPNAAAACYWAALALKPNDVALQCVLYATLLEAGPTEEALARLKDILRREPANAAAGNFIGQALVQQGKHAEAIPYLQAAIRQTSRNGASVESRSPLGAEALKRLAAEARNNLGVALVSQGKVDNGIRCYREAIRLLPDYALAHYNWGNALAEQGKTEEALEHYRAALQAKAVPAQLHFRMGLALARTGKTAEAISQYRSALEIQPDYLQAHKRLGIALADKGDIREALVHYRAALRLAPDDLEMLDQLAWVLATHPDAEIRHGVEAVRLATRAGELAGKNDVALMDTLAAAYAESGRFGEAASTAQRAIEMAEAAGQKELAATLRQRLQLYQSRRAFRTE